eukprot:scaffold1771_cov211-Alexandrium_tamarense.AAC.8
MCRRRTQAAIQCEPPSVANKTTNVLNDTTARCGCARYPPLCSPWQYTPCPKFHPSPHAPPPSKPPSPPQCPPPARPNCPPNSPSPALPTAAHAPPPPPCRT